MRGSSPQTSSCACSGKSASCQLWTPTTPSTHALEGQAAARAIWTSKNVRGLDLVAAPARGLEHAEEAGLLEVGDGLVGQAAESVGLGDAGGE